MVFPQATGYKPPTAFPDSPGEAMPAETRGPRSGRRLRRVYPQQANHGVRVTSRTPLWPPPPGEVAAGRRGVVGREVGSGVGGVPRSTWWAEGAKCVMRVHYEPSTTGYKPLSKPPPRPSPKGEAVFFAANRKAQAFCRLRTTAYKPQATHHLPRFSIPQTRPAGPAEIRGPCMKRSRGAAAADVPTLERGGGGGGKPSLCRCLPKAGLGASSGRDTSQGHRVTITTHHEPIGRTRGSVPTTRRHAPQTTSHRPRISLVSFF
ncbi:hypothetical protein HNQ05_002161 [Oceanithermus desulfurans]|uniref:Uncharacterized protein n=1 Tax=Oceanithermus desulfurans TaxID=227924 RepID=A0ABR6P3W8_9DEIN|nr:hypothetical protein [Oceanithermus desulfurans]